MPIRIPWDLPAVKTLQEENIFVMDIKRAAKQDIRPLQIETELLAISSRMPKHTSKEHMLAFYKSFDEIRKNFYDGLIITGAPVEQMPFEEVDYWSELCEIMEWSKSHVYSTFHICWGAQAGLYYHYGIEKIALPEKMFGIFSHNLNRASSA